VSNNPIRRGPSGPVAIIHGDQVFPDYDPENYGPPAAPRNLDDYLAAIDDALAFAGTSTVVVGRLANAGLRGIVGNAGQSVTVSGYDTPGDGGGGIFVWVATSQPNNDGTRIVPGVAYGANTAGAHWKRVQTGPLNVKWFGAKGDYVPIGSTGGTFDDAGFQRALLALARFPEPDWPSGLMTLLVPDGVYLISTPINIKSSQRLIGVGSPVLWGASPSLAAVVQLRNPNPIYDLIYGAQVKNLIIQGDGVTALDLFALESCAIDVNIGGKFTYGIKSEFNGTNGGVAYNCDIRLIRFMPGQWAIPTDYQQAVPPFGVWVLGAWTSTELRVDLDQNNEYAIRIVGAGVAAGLGALRITGLIQTAGFGGGGAGIGCYLQNVSIPQLSQLYFEGCVQDIVIDGCELVSVTDCPANVRLTNNRGVTVKNAQLVIADNTNRGVRVVGGCFTSADPPESVITDSIGIVSDYWSREVARGGVWVTGATVADHANLLVAGDMRRWNADGSLWGPLPWVSTIPSTKCGVGEADTTRTQGSPYCAKLISTASAITSGWKVCGPLSDAYLNTEITVSFKLKPIALGIAAAVEISDGTFTGWNPAGPSVTLFSAAGVANNGVPCENGFYLFRSTFTITAAQIANGIQVAILCYDTGSFYLSELQATFGKAAPRSYVPGVALDGSVVADQGAIVVVGSAPPVSATDPFYGGAWLVGDVCRNVAPSPGTPERWIVTAVSPVVWTPVTPARSSTRVVSGTTDTITAADAGSVVTYTSGSAVAVTVPAGLPAGFTCTLIQSGAGQLTLAGSGATLNSRNGLKTAGQYAAIGLQQTAANVYVLGGDTAP
jgi:hypothetical protein